jgi:hypothetical protein
MRVTILNLTYNTLSTDIGSIPPISSKFADLDPVKMHELSISIKSMVDAGLCSLTVTDEPGALDSLEEPLVDASITTAKLASATITPGNSKIPVSSATVGKLDAEWIPDASGTVAGKLSAGAQTIVGAKTFSTSIATTNFLASGSIVYTNHVGNYTTGSGLTLSGNPTDNASAKSVIVDTSAITASGSKLLSIQNATVEKASIDKDGGLNIGAPLTVLGGATLNPLVFPAPGVGTSAATGGTLLAGANYYYRVSAINALGETLCNAECTILTPGTFGVSPDTCTASPVWSASTGATGYKVYGRSIGAEALLATVGQVLTWTDTNTIGPVTAMPTRNTTADSIVGGSVTCTGLNTSGGSISTGAGIITTTTVVVGATGLVSTGGSSLALFGNSPNDAVAPAVKIGNVLSGYAPLTVAGAKIVSFRSNNALEKAYVDKAGALGLGDTTVAAPMILTPKEELPAACVATKDAGVFGAVDAGNHIYKATFVTPEGESIAGAVSNTVATETTHLRVNLTAIPIGSSRCSARNVYRNSIAVPATWRLLATISNNTATTLTDDATDASIVAAAVAPAVNTTTNHVSSVAIAGQKDIKTSFTATNAGTCTLDLAVGNAFYIDASALNAGHAFTIAVSNHPSSGYLATYSVIIKFGAALPTITLPAGWTAPAYIISTECMYTNMSWDGGVVTRTLAVGSWA